MPNQPLTPKVKRMCQKGLFNVSIIFTPDERFNAFNCILFGNLVNEFCNSARCSVIPQLILGKVGEISTLMEFSRARPVDPGRQKRSFDEMEAPDRNATSLAIVSLLSEGIPEHEEKAKSTATWAMNPQNPLYNDFEANVKFAMWAVAGMKANTLESEKHNNDEDEEDKDESSIVLQITPSRLPREGATYVLSLESSPIDDRICICLDSQCWSPTPADVHLFIFAAERVIRAYVCTGADKRYRDVNEVRQFFPRIRKVEG